MNSRSERPAGVFAVAVVFFLATGYLCALAAVMLVAPGVLSMALGAPLLGGLELAGPLMFLLMGGLGALMGWGLLRLNRWARQAAIVVAMVGFAMLIPSFSSAVAEMRAGRLISTGLGVIVRVVIVWYLWQEPVAEHFAKHAKNATD